MAVPAVDREWFSTVLSMIRLATKSRSGSNKQKTYNKVSWLFLAETPCLQGV